MDIKITYHQSNLWWRFRIRSVRSFTRFGSSFFVRDRLFRSRLLVGPSTNHVTINSTDSRYITIENITCLGRLFRRRTPSTLSNDVKHCVCDNLPDIAMNDPFLPRINMNVACSTISPFMSSMKRVVKSVFCPIARFHFKCQFNLRNKSTIRSMFVMGLNSNLHVIQDYQSCRS